MNQRSGSQSSSLEEILKNSTPTIKGREIKGSKADRFIKGPIPFKWITQASRLSESALKVGLVLWFLSGLTKSETVKLSNRYLDDFGLHRSSKYQALKLMQEVGLISYTHEKGGSPMVTILDGL